jgi:hypothetical protein
MIRNPRRVYRWTLGLWCALVAAHLAKYLHDVFSSPPSPDLYANALGFQLIAFGLTQLSYWIVALIVLLLLEFLLLRRR